MEKNRRVLFLIVLSYIILLAGNIYADDLPENCSTEDCSIYLSPDCTDYDTGVQFCEWDLNDENDELVKHAARCGLWSD